MTIGRSRIKDGIDVSPAETPSNQACMAPGNPYRTDRVHAMLPSGPHFTTCSRSTSSVSWSVMPLGWRRWQAVQEVDGSSLDLVLGSDHGDAPGDH